MHCRAFNVHLSTRKIKLHANQQKILLEEGLNVVSPHFTTCVFKHYPQIYSKFMTLLSQYKVKMKNNDPFVLVQGHFNLKSTTTLSSQYKVTSIQNLRPSYLSTRSKWKNKTTLSYQYKVKMKPSRLGIRSLQSKIYDLLVSVQGQNEKMTLSSQYKVNMKKKNDPLVSVQGHFNPKFTTLSSQYKVKMKKTRPSRLSTRSLQSKIYDPLVSVQGHFNKKFTTLSS